MSTLWSLTKKDGEVVCVTEDYYKREKIEDDLEGATFDIGILRTRIGNLTDDFDAFGDRFEEKSFEFKRMVELSERLNAVDDLLIELENRLEGMKK